MTQPTTNPPPNCTPNDWFPMTSSVPESALSLADELLSSDEAVLVGLPEVLSILESSPMIMS